MEQEQSELTRPVPDPVFVVFGNGDANVPRDVQLNVVLDSSGSDLGPAGPSSIAILEMTVELEDSTFLNSFLTTPVPASGACSAGVCGYYYLVQPVTLRQKGSLNTCSAFQEAPRNERPTGECP